MFIKQLITILLITLLTACFFDEKSKRVRFNYSAKITDVIMYGDSLCTDRNSAPHLMGIKKDCINGRTLLDLDPIDYDHRVIFLALGINDIRQGISSEEYKNKLTSVIAENIICVLPNKHPSLYSEDHRLVAIEVCEMYIDPVSDCDVSIGHSDGIHYISEDHESLAACLSKMI